MSKFKSKFDLVEGLRDIYDYREKFDVFLACTFESCERGNEKFDFYDKIGKVVESVGKKPYLPHKEIDLNWPAEKIYDIPNQIVIPSSDIVIGYLGVQSYAAGIMIGSAFNYRIPVSYLYEKESGLDALKYQRTDLFTGETQTVDPGFRGNIYDLIEFENEEEALEKLKLSLEVFYKHG